LVARGRETLHPRGETRGHSGLERGKASDYGGSSKQQQAANPGHQCRNLPANRRAIRGPVKLRELAARAEDIQGDLAGLERGRHDWLNVRAHLTRLEAYAKRVAGNLDTLTYEEKRRTLYALDVPVTVGKAGMHTDEDGSPRHWEGALRPFGKRAISFMDVEAVEALAAHTGETAGTAARVSANTAAHRLQLLRRHWREVARLSETASH
jgi:hypothetical protein